MSRHFTYDDMFNNILVLTMWVVVSPEEVLTYINPEIYFNLLYFARYKVVQILCLPHTSFSQTTLTWWQQIRNVSY